MFFRRIAMTIAPLSLVLVVTLAAHGQLPRQPFAPGERARATEQQMTDAESPTSARSFPADTALAATFNPSLVRRVGGVMALDARTRGFNVILRGVTFFQPELASKARGEDSAARFDQTLHQAAAEDKVSRERIADHLR